MIGEKLKYGVALFLCYRNLKVMTIFFFLYVKALKSREHGCILAGSTSGATERSWQSSEPVEPDGVLLDGFADAASRSDRGCAAAAGHGARQRSQAIRHHPLG